MNTIVDMLASHSMFENERHDLDSFYRAMVERIKAVHTLAGKQEIMRTLYDRFFSQAFPRMSERLGIVFTPVEIVDFIIRSADDAMRTAFGQSLGDPGVAIIEPFAGTGTFVARLLQLGVIPPEDLERKYKNEIFANEFVLLSYYIASINIEQVYHQVRAEQGVEEGYVEFPGMTLTDTFQLHEGDGTITEDFEGLAANNERAKAEKNSTITVIVMNPPYSAKQTRVNDNNQNIPYPHLDQRIAETYTKESTAENKNNLYDSYLRALRWSSDRLQNKGVIAFVSNNSFIDGNTADGVRLSLQEEFSQIFIFNLLGATIGRIGDTADREGGSVFDIQVGVAITVLIKDPQHKGQAEIFYSEVSENATRQEKLDQIVSYESIEKIMNSGDFKEITPNKYGDWITSRDESFTGFQTIASHATKGSIHELGVFQQSSRALETSRDSWCYNFSAETVITSINRLATAYNDNLSQDKINYNSKKISWTRKLKGRRKQGKPITPDSKNLRHSTYRPFTRQSVYFSTDLNEYTNSMPTFFPTQAHPNICLVIKQPASKKPFGNLLTCEIPDLNILGASTGVHAYPLYVWEPVPTANTGELDLFTGSANLSENYSDERSIASCLDFSRPIGDQIPAILDGYRRVDNVTDATLASYREHYEDAGITKEDIFFYVYALLHHPEYRERYRDDLTKTAPRIPRAMYFYRYAEVGRELADLHVNYERVEPYPSVQEEASLHAPADPWERYRIGERKMRFPALGRREKDFTRVEYNDYVTLTGIPTDAQGYSISGYSPLEWIMDRYYVKTDKASGIVNDPNDFLREQGRPDAVVDLIKRLVTVSMRTQELLATLPKLEIPE